MEGSLAARASRRQALPSEKCLRHGQHSLADIAFLLGFTDRANSTRAFRRWTAKTPRKFLS